MMMRQNIAEDRQNESNFVPIMRENNPRYNIDILKQQQADNVSIYELDQNPLIERVKHNLAGEMFDPETGQWVIEEGLDPPMNKKGVHHFIIKFGGHLDKNITLSDFNIEKINEMMVEIVQDIMEIFWKKASDFNIRRESMRFILHIIEHNIYANYMRALNGGERKHRETIIKSVENIRDIQDAQQQSNGGFGFLKNPFKRPSQNRQYQMHGGAV